MRTVIDAQLRASCVVDASCPVGVCYMVMYMYPCSSANLVQCTPHKYPQEGDLLLE